MAIQSKAAKQTTGQFNQDLTLEAALAVVPTSDIPDVFEVYVDATKLPTQQEDADPADADDEETAIAAARTGGGGDGANGTNDGTAMEEGSDEHFVPADDSETEGDADLPQKKGQPAKKTGGGNTDGADDMEFVMEFDEADPGKPGGRKAAAAGKAPAKSNGGDKKRSASHSKSSAVDGDDDTDAEPPKKKGRGRPPKNKPEEESNTAKKTPAKATPNAVHQADDTAAAAEARPSSTSRGRGGRTRGGGRPSSVAATAALAAARSKSTTKKKTQTQAAEREEKAHNLFVSQEGKNAFFRVELLIGPPGERVRMAPISEVQREDGVLSIDSYVAIEGQPFAIRIKIARPRSSNAVYGGRVYIDAPVRGSVNVTTSAAGRTRSSSNKQLNDGMDHFFWIGSGETEYIIEGFYKNQAESQQFVFAKPTQQNTRRSIGSIRIDFSLLDRWEQREGNHTFNPKQAAINSEASIELKGKELSAKPGDTVIDNVLETEREAVLSDEIVFEKRIDYNTLCGYKASQETRKYFNDTKLYKGLPIVALKQEDVRIQCIDMYLTQIPSKLSDDKFFENLKNTAGQSSSEGAAPAVAAASIQSSGKPDKWWRVQVTDIVDAICEDLSPAGSYLICTGQYHVDGTTGIRNYGETVLQNFEATSEEKRADYEAKVEGLKRFFAKNPHAYDSQDYGFDEETGRTRFEVCKAVVDLMDSDDEFS